MFFSESKKRRNQPVDVAEATFTLPGATRERLEALLTVCRNNLKTVDEELIARAFEVSAQAHRHHIRRSGEPYFTHPYAVAMIVAQEIPLDDISVVAALLHDVIEDNKEYTQEEIAKQFGATVADIVDGATKISSILLSREVTKAENYRKLMVSMIQDIRVILVKFADRLHNMRTLEFVNSDKQKRIAKETLEIYAPLAHRFGLGQLKWEFEDLSFKYLHEKEYRQLKEQIALKRRDREAYIAKFTKPIEVELRRNDLPFEINGRPKHLYSIFKKMQDRDKTIDEIYDLFAVRIILDTDDERDCYMTYAIVCEIYTPIPERYKNYIALEKKNGYKSIHTTVLGPEGKMVEVQIRTKAMHEIAEKGIAAHWAYKESTPNKQTAFENWVRWVRDILEAPQGAGSDEEGAQQLIEDFKRNLYQDEIVVFTPKGDLINLPKDATPVDFAFEIHSEVGLHTIGAKVNGRIVPLSRKLRSGDRVEVITSRNQFISPDWEQLVITNKARNAIRRHVSEQNKALVQKGREKWERKIKKMKPQPTEEQMLRAVNRLKLQSITKMFIAIGSEEVDVDDILTIIRETEAQPLAPLPTLEPSQVFTQFADQARSEQGILIQGIQTDVQYDFARCCNPLPGDEIIGFVTRGHGIKIHRKNCRNILRLMDDQNEGEMRERLIDIDWPASETSEYLGGIRMEGDDRPGILNEIALSITSYNNTNIRSVNIETEDAHFYGSVLVSVKNLEHLQRLIERVRKVKGVSSAERFVEVT